MAIADPEVVGHHSAGTPGGQLLDSSGTLTRDPTQADIERALAAGQFFWLNLAEMGEQELAWLRDLFAFHPLAIEDAVTFGERPKLEEYDDHVLLVMYGSGSDDGASPSEGQGAPSPPAASPPAASPPAASPPAAQPPAGAHPSSGADEDPKVLLEELDDVMEVHCFVSARFLVTIDRGRCRAFARLADRLCEHKVAVSNPARLFHRVADILVDSFFPVLTRLDDRIDQIESELIVRPQASQMGELLSFRRSLITLRRVITPQRDMFASLSSGVVDLPGLDDEAQRYYRDVYDHLIRLSDLVDGYRDLLSGATDAYLSVTSNQLNVVMKQLAIISTVFLPLSFLTGFFGQNFPALVNNIGGWEWFLFAGLGSELVVVVSMMALFKSRGWLGRAA